MAQIQNGDPVRVVLSAPSIRLSTLAGLLACAFAMAGVFAFPIVFVPVALACALVGTVASVRRRNIGGLAAAMLGAMIAIGAAIKSSVIWLTIMAIVVGIAGLFAAHQPSKPVHAAARTRSAPSQNAARPEASPPSLPPSGDRKRTDVLEALAAAKGFNADAPGLTATLDRYAAGFRQAADQIDDIAVQIASAPPHQRERLLAALAVAQDQLDQRYSSYLTLHNEVTSRLPRFQAKLSAGLDACTKRIDLKVSIDCRTLMSEMTSLRENAYALNASSIALQRDYKLERNRVDALLRRVSAGEL